jgi:hypothetical protein
MPGEVDTSIHQSAAEKKRFYHPPRIERAGRQQKQALEQHNGKEESKRQKTRSSKLKKKDERK